MKTLILSCTMGQGHNYAAKAVLEEFQQNNSECLIMDAYAFMHKSISSAIEITYNHTYSKRPAAFGRVYRAGGFVTSFKGHSPVYFANSLYANNLEKYIRENGYDTIVCTHLFPAEAITYLRRWRRLNIKSYAISTDYTCIPFWEEIDPDFFFVPRDLNLFQQSIKRGIPEEKMIQTGIPVLRKYNQKIPKDQAREMLNIPQNIPVYLLMTGGIGCGTPDILTKDILMNELSEDFRVIVMTGKSKTMLTNMKNLFDQDDRVILVPFSDDVNIYMDACDVLLTKAGGLSSTEAAVKNVPLVHVYPVPGVETINARFFEEHGMSIWAKSDQFAAEKAIALCRNIDAKEKMIAAQQKWINPHAAADIYQFIQQHA